VRATRLIKRGTFIGEYIGEKIDPHTASIRGKVYDRAELLYNFSLDYSYDPKNDQEAFQECAHLFSLIVGLMRWSFATLPDSSITRAKATI
jgi:hypothetical protein